MSSFFGGGGEKWDMKDDKINDMRGGLGAKPPRSQSILMPEKEMEIIFVTPHGLINEILTPPHPHIHTLGLNFFS